MEGGREEGGGREGGRKERWFVGGRESISQITYNVTVRCALQHTFPVRSSVVCEPFTHSNSVLRLCSITYLLTAKDKHIWPSFDLVHTVIAF